MFANKREGEVREGVEYFENVAGEVALAFDVDFDLDAFRLDAAAGLDFVGAVAAGVASRSHYHYVFEVRDILMLG